MSKRHVKSVEFLQDYSVVLKHRSILENKVVDALSRLATILHSMSNKVVEFELIKDKYSTCPDFGTIFTYISNNHNKNHVNFLMQDDTLFKGVKLCILHTSLREFLVWELHDRV